MREGRGEGRGGEENRDGIGGERREMDKQVQRQATPTKKAWSAVGPYLEEG